MYVRSVRACVRSHIIDAVRPLTMLCDFEKPSSPENELGV
jgi:hypothetical protein